MNNVRNMWRFIYTVQHLGMFYCCCSSSISSQLSSSLPSFRCLKALDMFFSFCFLFYIMFFRPLARFYSSCYCQIPCIVHMAVQIPCSQLFILFDLAHFTSLSVSNAIPCPCTQEHAHTHSYKCHSFHSCSRSAYIYIYVYILFGDYYCYCYSSFVIWSRAKYWIHHKWYYFICCVVR